MKEKPIQVERRVKSIQWTSTSNCREDVLVSAADSLEVLTRWMLSGEWGGVERTTEGDGSGEEEYGEATEVTIAEAEDIEGSTNS
jgi:hypothetical protein